METGVGGGILSTQNLRYTEKTCDVFKAVKSLACLELQRNRGG